MVDVLLTPLTAPPTDELLNDVCVKLPLFPNKSFIPSNMSCIPPPIIFPKGESPVNEPKLPPSNPKGDRFAVKRNKTVIFIGLIPLFFWT